MPKFTIGGTNKSVLFVADRKAASAYFLLGKAALKERLKGLFLSLHVERFLLTMLPLISGREGL